MAMLQSICRCRISRTSSIFASSAKRTMSSTFKSFRFSGAWAVSVEKGFSNRVSPLWRRQTTLVC